MRTPLGLKHAVDEINLILESVDFNSMGGFPAAGSTSYDILKSGIKVLDFRDCRYNCFAAAVGEVEWIEFEGELSSFFYEVLLPRNFVKTSRPRRFSKRYDLVAVYTKDDEVTHLARKVRRGWESKCGQAATIFHPTLEVIAGGIYGEPTAFFERKR